MVAVTTLLIEPVWNRNATEVGGIPIISTFNRTSMESKLRHRTVNRDTRIAFNRTSMESKPFYATDEE